MIPFIVGCALFMQMLDSTVVATALPAMAAALGSTPVRLNVAITSYLLAVAVFVPISGWAADRFGARRVLIAAIALFTLSSVGCALSQNLGQLVVARIVQGMAGAMMVPVGRIILLRTVPKQDLLKAMSFLSIPALLGPVIGPPVGGFMVTYMSWHWIFLINIPIGILGIALVLRFVSEIREENAPRLDLPGFLLSGICLAALVSAFEALGHGLLPPLELGALIAAGLLCGVLYVWHSRRVEHPILDLSLLRTPTFAISVLGGNLCRFAVGAVPFLLAMLLQVGFGLSPFAADEIRGHAHRHPLRVSPRPDDQRHPHRPVHRRLRRLHPRDAGLGNDRRAAGRRFLPFAAIHGGKYANLCRYRPRTHEPRQQLRRHGAAARHQPGGRRGGRHAQRQHGGARRRLAGHRRRGGRLHGGRRAVHAFGAVVPPSGAIGRRPTSERQGSP